MTIPKKSKSGYYRVTISRGWPDRGFTYSPAHDITVDEETLGRMKAEAGLVTHVVAAD